MKVGLNGQRVAAAGAVGIALFIAGCGSSASTTSLGAIKNTGHAVDTANVIPAAAAASANEPGYKVNLKMQIKTSQLPSAINATGNGSFSTASRVGSLNLSMDLGAIPGVSAVLGGSTFTIQEVLEKTTIYMKLPAALTAKLPGGKPWFKLNLAQLASSTGQSGISSLLNNPTSSNPGEILQYLRATSSGVTKVGSATIAGVPTTHYSATIDLSKISDAVPAAQQAAVKQAIASLEKMTSLRSLPINVWIDGRNLVRQVALDITEKTSTAGSVGVNLTMDLSDYGPQAAPAIPPASQVTDGTSLLGAAAGSGSTTIG